MKVKIRSFSFFLFSPSRLICNDAIKLRSNFNVLLRVFSSRKFLGIGKENEARSILHSERYIHIYIFLPTMEILDTDSDHVITLLAVSQPVVQ